MKYFEYKDLPESKKPFIFNDEHKHLKKTELPNPKDPLGYTDWELRTICRKRKILYRLFSKAFGVNTVAIGDDGKPRYYRCDVERALWNLRHKDGKYHVWD